MKAKKQKRKRELLWRTIVVFSVFLVVGVVLGGRLWQLQVTQGSEWVARANAQQLKSSEIPAKRGTIYDSKMNILAESAPVWTVEAAPDVMAKSRLTKDTAGGDAARIASQELARILSLDENVLYENLSDKEKKYYKVKGQIEKLYADEIREMVSTKGISGIYLKEDTKRYYPYEDLAASVLGFVSDDSAGVEGFEWQYEEELAGVPGRLITARNANGEEMHTSEDSIMYPAIDGQNIVLTLDVEIQRSLEEHLIRAINRYNAAERGFGIVMNAKTGAIYAMATKPDFNPNDPYFIFDTATREAVEAMPDGEEKVQAQSDARIKQWRNKAVSDFYEPGSVFKVVTAAAALDSGLATPDTTYYCSGALHVDGWDKPIGCAGGKAHGTLTLSQALIESCNISFVQIAQQEGIPTWYSYLNSFGLTEPTGVDLPGEPSQKSINALVRSQDSMTGVDLAGSSFGQGNSYTGMQMITAMAAAVNGGNLIQPHIVDSIVDSNGNVVHKTETVVKRQVISAETSAELCEMMEELVSGSGYGKNAFVEGYHVGGKSGTSQKLAILSKDENDKRYISSFMAFAPANDPEIVVLMVLDEPQDHEMGNYFGGRLVGPSIGNVISDTVEILGMEPDYGEGEGGRATVATPNLADLAVENAAVSLNKVGLSYTVVGEGATVVSQYPEVGALVPRGGTIMMYVTRDPMQTVAVPNITGSSATQAIASLKLLGLNVLTSGAPDNGSGVVVAAQDIVAGETVPLGTVISLELQDSTAVGDLAG